MVEGGRFFEQMRKRGEELRQEKTPEPGHETQSRSYGSFFERMHHRGAELRMQREAQETQPEQRERRLANGMVALGAEVAGLTIFGAKTIGEVLKRLLTTDFGTAKGWEEAAGVQQKIEKGYQKGLKQAA